MVVIYRTPTSSLFTTFSILRSQCPLPPSVSSSLIEYCDRLEHFLELRRSLGCPAEPVKVVDQHLAMYRAAMCGHEIADHHEEILSIWSSGWRCAVASAATDVLVVEIP